MSRKVMTLLRSATQAEEGEKTTEHLTSKKRKKNTTSVKLWVSSISEAHYLSAIMNKHKIALHAMLLQGVIVAALAARGDQAEDTIHLAYSN